MDHDNDHLRRMNRMLTGLSRVNRTILRVRDDRKQLMEEACCTIREQIDCELVWLGEINRSGDVIWGTCSGIFPEEPEPSITADQDQLERAPTTSSSLLALREIAVHAAVEQQPTISERISNNHPDCASLDWRISAIPVTIDPTVSFVLLACTDQDHEFASEEIGILVEMAGDLGMAIETIEIQNRTRNAERALRISEDRFRKLSENSLVGIVLVQNDLYRYVNPAFAEMFGYESTDDIIDKLGPLDLTAPESVALVHENIQKRVLGQIRSACYQYHGLRKDGTIFEVEEHGARTIHAQRLAVVATVLDVTAREASRRRIEALSQAGLILSQAQTLGEALDRAVEQVASILPCEAATIVTVDRYDQQPEALVSYPRHASTILVVTDSEGRTITPAQLGRILAMDDSAWISNRQQTSVVIDDSDRSYAAAPLVARGKLVGLLAIEAPQIGAFSEEDARHLRLFADHVAATLQHLRLISSLEVERNRLRTANELSRLLSGSLQLREVATRALCQIGTTIRASISVLYLWDAESGTMTAVAAEGLSHQTLMAINHALVTGESAIKQDILEAGPPDTKKAVADRGNPRDLHRRYLELISDQEGIEIDKISSVLDVPLEIHGERVGMLSFLARGVGFNEKDKELAMTLGVTVALAIQNARFYEKAAKQAELMAEALHRQEELDRIKDELIQNISHELRTPLSLVMGYADMLNRGELGPMPAEQEAAVGVIARRSHMLRSLVEDIAMLWHLEHQTAQKERIDLQAIVTTTAAEFQKQADTRNLELSAHTGPDSVIIQAVPLQIRRVLDNLLSNSLKFTPPGGRLCLALETNDVWAEVSIADTGIGVPEDKLQRIFDRFYQVDGTSRRKYGGTGLGLALVKAIVEEHGGTIHAESPVTNDPARPGTKVTVRFPLAEAPQVS